MGLKIRYPRKCFWHTCKFYLKFHDVTFLDYVHDSAALDQTFKKVKV